MRNKVERVVYIMRKISFHQAANNDPEVQEYFGMSYRAIGSYFKEFGKTYGSGLTREEEVILMPEVTDQDPDDRRSLRRAISDYFRNMNTKIPGAGLRLNIALEKPGEKLSETNFPVNVKHYLIYKHAIGHPEVAMSLEEAERYEHKQFYIEDTEGVANEANLVNEKEDLAFIAYHQMADDEDKIDQMLVLLGENPSRVAKAKKKPLLKSFASIDPNASQENNIAKVDKFIALSEDKHLQTKYTIEEMIRVDVLERVGQKILIKETGDLIGDDLRGATLWFLDKANSKDVNVLTARYKEFAK